jgi:hypothetical protein
MARPLLSRETEAAMPNNAQPYQEKSSTPKQDMQRQPQATQRDPGIMPPQRAPMPQQGKEGKADQRGQRDQSESNVKQSTRNNADVRNEANKSIQSQQAQSTDRDDERGLQGQKGFENEGEGNKTAARNYDDQTEKFAKSGGVEPAAKEAQRAYEGAEGSDLREAERRGREGKVS